MNIELYMLGRELYAIDQTACALPVINKEVFINYVGASLFNELYHMIMYGRKFSWPYSARVLKIDDVEYYQLIAL